MPLDSFRDQPLGRWIRFVRQEWGQEGTISGSISAVMGHLKLRRFGAFVRGVGTNTPAIRKDGGLVNRLLKGRAH